MPDLVGSMNFFDLESPALCQPGKGPFLAFLTLRHFGSWISLLPIAVKLTWMTVYKPHLFNIRK